MNISDDKVLDLSNALFVKRDGEIITHPFYGHAKIATRFFGIDVTMPEKEALANQKRYLMYRKYCDEVGYIDLLDFMIRFYGYDRCCAIGIISSRTNLYEYYWNYYLAGYSLHRKYPIGYDDMKEDFYNIEDFDDYKRDLERKERADMIRSRVPKEERYKYYK